MLTLFTMPKPFRGHIATIQRNAIGSWVRLRPPCQILIFGDEEGTGDVAKKFGVCHVPEVAKNEYGTPLVSDLFEKARRLASHNLLCYVNSDIILMDDFVRAVDRVSRLRKYFLMVGQCWNLEVAECLAFDQPEWEEDLRGLVRHRGKLRGPFAIDYFAFPRGFYEHVPPFSLGRAYFDNWFIWKARSLKATVVDATRVVTAIHQNHDYSHVPGGISWSYHGVEAIRNLEVGGGLRHRYLIFDATHRLDPGGLKRNVGGFFRLKTHWKIAKSQMGQLGWWILELTRPIRHPLGLHMANFEWVKARLNRQRR